MYGKLILRKLEYSVKCDRVICYQALSEYLRESHNEPFVPTIQKSTFLVTMFCINHRQLSVGDLLSEEDT